MASGRVDPKSRHRHVEFIIGIAKGQAGMQGKMPRSAPSRCWTIAMPSQRGSSDIKFVNEDPIGSEVAADGKASVGSRINRVPVWGLLPVFVGPRSGMFQKPARLVSKGRDDRLQAAVCFEAKADGASTAIVGCQQNLPSAINSQMTGAGATGGLDALLC